MIFRYNPTKEIVIDKVGITFLEPRELVRTRIGAPYKENNKVFDLGDGTIPITRKRDIYQNINNSNNFFFLNYNSSDDFRDITIHHCDEIKIFDISFTFLDDIDSIAMRIMKYSEDNKENSGEYIFFDLKIVIMSQQKMGAEGNSLGYFYCTSDISHLRE